MQFYSPYNTDWIANTEIGLDPNNSVIKRLWCIYKCNFFPQTVRDWNVRDCISKSHLLKLLRMELLSLLLFPFFLPIHLNLHGGHQTRFGIQVQSGGGGG